MNFVLIGGADQVEMVPDSPELPPPEFEETDR